MTTTTPRESTTTPQQSALIVVDVQNDFVSGSLAVTDGEQVAQKIAKGLLVSRELNDFNYVVATQDWHIDPGTHWSENPDYVDTWPVHCEAEKDGSQLHPSLEGKVVWDERFRKGHYSASYSGYDGIGNKTGDSLDFWLTRRNVGRVTVVGIATDFCVKATALDAVKLGYDTTVLLPYTAAVSPEGLAVAIDELKNAGVHVL